MATTTGSGALSFSVDAPPIPAAPQYVLARMTAQDGTISLNRRRRFAIGMGLRARDSARLAGASGYVKADASPPKLVRYEVRCSHLEKNTGPSPGQGARRGPA